MCYAIRRPCPTAAPAAPGEAAAEVGAAVDGAAVVVEAGLQRFEATVDAFVAYMRHGPLHTRGRQRKG